MRKLHQILNSLFPQVVQKHMLGEVGNESIFLQHPSNVFTKNY